MVDGSNKNLAPHGINGIEECYKLASSDHDCSSVLFTNGDHCDCVRVGHKCKSHESTDGNNVYWYKPHQQSPSKSLDLATQMAKYKVDKEIDETHQESPWALDLTNNTLHLDSCDCRSCDTGALLSGAENAALLSGTDNATGGVCPDISTCPRLGGNGTSGCYGVNRQFLLLWLHGTCNCQTGNFHSSPIKEKRWEFMASPEAYEWDLLQFKEFWRDEFLDHSISSEVTVSYNHPVANAWKSTFMEITRIFKAGIEMTIFRYLLVAFSYRDEFWDWLLYQFYSQENVAMLLGGWKMAAEGFNVFRDGVMLGRCIHAFSAGFTTALLRKPSPSSN